MRLCLILVVKYFSEFHFLFLFSSLTQMFSFHLMENCEKQVKYGTEAPVFIVWFMSLFLKPAVMYPDTL